MPANLISGRVTLKESGIGIPDLLVVIYDVDPESETDGAREGGAEHEEREEGLRTVQAPSGLGDRLGSSLTDRDGAFHLSFEDDEFRIQDAKERRPDLHLVVMAPEEPGVGPRVLFTSPERRQDAGRAEGYVIRLPSEILTPEGMPVPTDATSASVDDD